MNISWKANRLSAFLVGIAVVLPAIASTLLDADVFFHRVIGALVVVGYLASMFALVIGSMEWDRFWWIPIDGITPCIVRTLFWLFGAGVAGFTYEYAQAI